MEISNEHNWDCRHIFSVLSCTMYSITLKKITDSYTMLFLFVEAGGNIELLLFTGAVVQLHKKRDQPDFYAVVSGYAPLQNSWRNDVTGQRDFPCDNSDGQHPFKHTKCSSHIQGNRCQNVRNIVISHASITMRYGTQGNIFPST